jgi:uncharacterized repeat protein (TIGR03803 family)
MPAGFSVRTFVLRCLWVVGAVVACSGWPGEAYAYSFLRLADFTGGADGAAPLAGVILDETGTVYGTTSAGAKDFGTVYAIAPGKPLETLYTFCSRPSCSDGSSPHAGLIMDQSGNLYGTTNAGGGHNGGAVFELTRGGVERVLYGFCARIINAYCGDGSFPVAGLIIDKAGNLYGTTTLGGANDVGVVFELSFDPGTGLWDETVLYNFCPKGTPSGCADGQTPLAGLTMDAVGNLFGTTEFGGADGEGVVFEVQPRLGSEKVLYSFCSQPGCADGSEPNAGVIIDQAGHLYGTARYGGNSLYCGNGGGVVFEVEPLRHSEKVRYAFCSNAEPPSDGDGSYPEAGLIIDAKGDLYGTTNTGGITGQGVVFRLAGRQESVLASFCSHAGCPEFPLAGVTMDKAGNLYGTTEQSIGGDGTVYELKK